MDVVKPRECLCPTEFVDLQKFEALAAHFKGADAVVHLARIRFPYTETGFDPVKQQCSSAIQPAMPTASSKTLR